MKTNLAYVIRISLVATLGGLLFGYDTAVISGAIGFMKIHFSLSPGVEGWVASSALFGCMIGAFFAGIISDKMGRKYVLMLAGVLFLISAMGTAFPRSLTMFILFRILGGIGVGAAAMASPMYIAELSPAKYRGGLVSLNQLAIISGMLIVYFANYLIATHGNQIDSAHGILPESTDSWNVTYGWRWMFGSESLPALLLISLLFFVPNSPRWLISKNRDEEAKRIIKQIEGENTKNKIAEIKMSISNQGDSLKQLWAPGLRIVLIIALALAFFQQSTGINAILYFAPEILKGISDATSDIALLQTIIIGVVNLLFTIVGIFAVDRLGRRPLMLLGYAGMGIALFALGITTTISSTQGVGALIMILIYIACFACSVGPITWVILSEIFPTNIRGRAMSIATIVLWAANFLVSQTFPMMNGNDWLIRIFNHGFPFIIYGLFCVLALSFHFTQINQFQKQLKKINIQEEPL